MPASTPITVLSVPNAPTGSAPEALGEFDPHPPALVPITTLSVPVVIPPPAPAPIKMLSAAVVCSDPALYPIIVFKLPDDRLCAELSP